ncbi:MAG TPA: hypothetical protein VNA26_04030 [Chitinophagaceae bacterium]|nr:hypothetical protein [Chitinophagaceae bacterium]
MKFFLPYVIPVVWCFFFLQKDYLAPTQKVVSSIDQPISSTDLFGSEEVLQIKLSGNIRQLFNDRGDAPKYHPLELTYKNAEGKDVTITLKGKTRGNFRRSRENCTYPPILLNFQSITSKGSIFQEQDKLKLVMPCQEEEYIFREYLVYKVYNLITPKSFRARLVKVNFYDAQKKKETVFNGFLIEEEEQMAKRNKTRIIDRKQIPGESTETETFLKMAVFQYMIGNTDWSVPFLHNIRIIAFDSLSIPSVVPYDFDHAGIVDAPYAMPAEQLALSSTQERRFRGYCITDWKTMDEVIATFNRVKDDVYKLYTTNNFLSARYVKATTRFLDDFYETINNQKKMRSEFTHPCKEGAPRITIKGLQN